MTQDGTLVVADGRGVLRFERTLHHPPETVFAALLDPDSLRAWFPCRIDGGWEVGAPLTFTFETRGEADARSAGNGFPITSGEVVAHDPPRHLEYTWDQETLRFDLSPTDDGGTLLIFVHTFPDPESAPNYAGGWHQLLDALAAHLDGGTPDLSKARNAEITAAYGQLAP